MEIIDNVRYNMKRIVLLGTLGAVSLMSLAACGTSTDTTSNPTDTPVAPAASLSTTATDTPVSASMSSTDTPAQAPSDTSSQATPTVQAPSDTSSQAAPTQAASGQSSANVQINATLKEWAIDLSQSEVAAGKVQFVVTNEGMMRHNLTILDSSGSPLGMTPTFESSEGPQTLEVDLKPGTYTLICSLPGHADRGQKAQLVVK